MVSLSQTLRRTVELHPIVRKVLLGCGIASSALYVVSDILGTLRYPGYRYKDQVFSELTALGSPVRSFMVVSNGIPYTVLVTAFGIGVWTSAQPKRTAQITGTMLTGYALTGMTGGVLFPMPTRGTEGSLRNTMHIPATAVMSLFILSAMGFGARLLGKRFQYYSYATIAVLLLFGVLTSRQGGQIAANEPTPWAGIEERVNIYATMLWVVVLAGGLMRGQQEQLLSGQGNATRFAVPPGSAAPGAPRPSGSRSR